MTCLHVPASALARGAIIFPAVCGVALSALTPQPRRAAPATIPSASFPRLTRPSDARLAHAERPLRERAPATRHQADHDGLPSPPPPSSASMPSRSGQNRGPPRHCGPLAEVAAEADLGAGSEQRWSAPPRLSAREQVGARRRKRLLSESRAGGLTCLPGVGAETVLIARRGTH